MFEIVYFSDKPDIDKSPGASKAGFNRGEKAKLVCQASGANNITFYWQKEGHQLATLSQKGRGASKYVAVVTRPSPLVWQSALYIENVGSADYGAYRCVATNALGSDQHTVTLDLKSHPDPPVDLRVLGVTYKSVTLTWAPGFDGGFRQSYRLRLKRVDSAHYFFVDVSPSDATRYEVADLQPSAEYSFAIMAYNAKGESNYTSTAVKATTASKYA